MFLHIKEAGGIIVGSTMPEVVTYYLSGLSHSCKGRKFVSDWDFKTVSDNVEARNDTADEMHGLSRCCY